MTQDVTFDKSVKVNLSHETYAELVKEAEEKGLSKSALARTKIRG